MSDDILTIINTGGCLRCGHPVSKAGGVTIKNLPMEQSAALIDVIKERMRQDQKWGEQNWDPQTYLSILLEEVGEAATEANDARFKLADREAALSRFRTEMVQSAAVALAIVECLDRGKWKWPTP